MSLWDVKAKFYRHARKIPPFSFILKQELARLRELLALTDFTRANVLDVGSGTGTVLDFFPRGVPVFAVDRSMPMLARSRARRPVYFVAADSLNLPFRTKSFTLATAIGVFEYQSDRWAFLQELQRVLEPSGFLILTYSQKSFLNYARNILGHKVSLVNDAEFRALLDQTRLTCKAERISLIQRQVLLQLKS